MGLIGNTGNAKNVGNSGSDNTMVVEMNDHYLNLVKLKIMEEDGDKTLDCSKPPDDQIISQDDDECVKETPGIWDDHVFDMKC